MPDSHQELSDVGTIPHYLIDLLLPTDDQKDFLRALNSAAPAEVTGARDDPEQALANLLAALDTLGLITDNTTAS